MGQIISAIQQKGGAGKSTMLCVLAGQLCEDGAKVLLIDTDPQGTVAQWAKKQAYDNLEFVPLLDETKLIKAANNASARYDAVIIDTAGFDNAMAVHVARVSDLVLIPTSCARSSLLGAANTWKQISKSTKNADTEPVKRLVMWGIKKQARIFPEAIRLLEEAQLPLVSFQVGNLTAFEEMTWTVGLPDSRGRAELNRFIAALQLEGLIEFYRKEGEGSSDEQAA